MSGASSAARSSAFSVVARSPALSVEEDSIDDGGLDGPLAPSSSARTEVRLHRRRQIVVVRAADSSPELHPLMPRGRRSVPTLPGLDARERLDTIPEESHAAHVGSHRPRPAVLLDDVDDDLAQEYLAEAERILREGLLAGTG